MTYAYARTRTDSRQPTTKRNCNTGPRQELLDKCHPLGMFDSIATLAVAQNMRELFRLVLVDTPLAPYFSENLTHEVGKWKNGRGQGEGGVVC